MAFTKDTFGAATQVLEQIKDRQPVTKKKSNTIVVAIGTIITAVLSVVTALVDAGAGLPDWAMPIIPLLGMAGTLLKVFFTKNGVTDSIIDEFNEAVAALVDAQEGQRVTHIPEVSAPVTSGGTTAPAPTEGEKSHARQIAETLDALADRLAQRR